MKEIKDSNKSQNEQNKNEIKEEEHSDLITKKKKRISLLKIMIYPNLKAFSDTKLAINFESFNNFIEKVFEDFQSKTSLEPLDLIQKLKWIS